MTQDVKVLYAKARQLSADEQAELVDLLLNDGSDTPSDWDRAWSEEAEARLAAYAQGKIDAIDAEAVLAEGRKRSAKLSKT
jgi:putative addiction module component (TIGR02574 family)